MNIRKFGSIQSMGKGFVFFVMVLSLLIPSTVFAEETDRQERFTISKEEMRLLETFKIIHGLHISGISEKQLSDSAIRAMVESLNDPYTTYYTKEQWKEFNESQSGNYVGIGVRVSEDANGVYIVEVFPGSPAEKAGLHTGDYIVGVNGQSSEDKTMDELVNMILGEEGSKVKITYKRGTEQKEVELVRAKITVPTITGMWLADTIGYIRISDFGMTTGTDFKKELEKMKIGGLETLILDLRNNPGGYLHTVREIASQFIPEGVLIHTKDRNGISDTYEIKNGKKPSFSTIVLVNEYSASGSEVLAGALQDYKAATVIGTTTFGKGSVQSFIPLSNGDVMKITVQEYLTPKKRKVNNVGITPDKIVEGEVPQLLEAMRMAGFTDIKLKLNEHFAVLNGQEFRTLYPLVRENGKVYISSRILASLLDAPIEWDPKTKQVTITKGERTFRYDSSTPGVLFRQGASFIEIDKFAEIFPQLIWEQNGDVVISVKKGQ